MSTLRTAAILLLITAAATVWTTSGGSTAGPPWFPPRWLRVGIPLVVTGGLWVRASWAWWGGVVISGLMSVLTVVAVAMVLAGGILARSNDRGLLVMSVSYLLIDLATFILLLLPRTRAAVQ